MTNPVCYSPTGKPRFCGLNVASKRAQSEEFKLYQDQAKLLTLDEIRKIITAPGRLAAATQFPAKTWIQTQVNNACAGFAAGAALGRTRVRRGLAPVVLSGDFIYANTNGNSDNGALLQDTMAFMQSGGIAPNDTVEIGTWQRRLIPDAAYEAAKRFKAFECFRVAEEIELLTGLARGFCGVVAVQVPRSGYETDSDGRVFATDGVGNHAVAVDDLRIWNGEIEVRSPNSWGTDWGVDGSGWLSWKRHFRTTPKYHAFYLIRSTIDDPNGLNPPQVEAA